jgi:Ribonuclease P 40kDa (Rpp40) subunit.
MKVLLLEYAFPVVQLDLNEQHFTPGKKFYDRVQRQLRENTQLKFNLLMAWDPPGTYFHINFLIHKDQEA